MRDLTGHAPISSPIFPSLISINAVTDGVVLGFDFGTRRIGVAISNGVTREARALRTIDAADNDARWSALTALIDEWEPTQLVVGTPRHPDGAPHAMTTRCERFALNWRARTLAVARVDERYSSALCRTRDVDAAAAAIIVQQWLDAPDA